MRKKRIIMFAAWIIFIIVLLIFLNSYISIKQVCFSEKCFHVEIVSTEQQRNLGLSFRDSLDKDRGMLFIFPTSDNYGFWTKDMKFNLDIIFMNENKEVVFVSKNNLPCENCSIIYPNEYVKYVLEINSGILNLSLGDQARFG